MMKFDGMFLKYKINIFKMNVCYQFQNNFLEQLLSSIYEINILGSQIHKIPKITEQNSQHQSAFTGKFELIEPVVYILIAKKQ